MKHGEGVGGVVALATVVESLDRLQVALLLRVFWEC